MSQATLTYPKKDNQIHEALAILKNLGCRKQKQKSISSYQLVKQIFIMINGRSQPETHNPENDDILNDVVQSPEAMDQMLVSIRDSLFSFLPTIQSNGNIDVSQVHLFQANLKSFVKQKNIVIQELQQKLHLNQKLFKNTQLKLLNNVKKLTQQLHQKQLQINELNQIIEEKEQQIQSFAKINEKKYRKIKDLEEQIRLLEQELEEKEKQLNQEKKCSALLQKTVDKIMDCPPSSLSEQKKQSDLEIELKRPQINQIGVQVIEQEENINDKISESSALTESKQSKYLESIERLTSELSEAYNRINDLMFVDKQKQSSRKSKTNSTYFGRAKK